VSYGADLPHPPNVNNAEAVAIRDWMKGQGGDDVFLDLDPERGLAAGDRWQTALRASVSRCESVVVLRVELVQDRVPVFEACADPKAILPVIVEPTPWSELPAEMTADYHLVDLTKGSRSATFGVKPPAAARLPNFAFPRRAFAPSQRGSGASASSGGKSSFLRAGLLPRIQRDDTSFLAVAVIRPGRAASRASWAFLRFAQMRRKVAMAIEAPAHRHRLRLKSERHLVDLTGQVCSLRPSRGESNFRNRRSPARL
jgi:hypothetical protein